MGDFSREVREAPSLSAAAADYSVSVGRSMAAVLWILNVPTKSQVEAVVAGMWHFWEVVEP